CLYESEIVVGEPIGAKSAVMPASTCVMTSAQLTAARSVALRATYVSNRAMNVCASRDKSLFVYVSPGIQPMLGIVNVDVSEIAIDWLSIVIVAAITAGYGEYVGVDNVSTSACSPMMA